MTPLTDSQSKHIRELLRAASARREYNEFIIEGPHALEVALAKRPELIQQVIFTEAATERYPKLQISCFTKKIHLFSLPAKLASRISETEEPQGIFAVLKIPDRASSSIGDFALALDSVQDPGNVGTIIRTAAWFGVKSLIFGEGTADPYAPKVVRSTQGALFEVNIETKANLGERLKKLQSDGWKIVATTLESKARSLYNIPIPQKTVLLLGSEAHGVSDELLRIADDQIIIPRYGEGESLNVATSAAIILAEFRRRAK